MSTDGSILPSERARPLSALAHKASGRAHEALSLESATHLRDAFLTLAALLLFGSAGAILKARFALMLPGPVIGLLLIAATLVLTEARSQRLANRLHVASAPSARRLLAHMGLLFVPAGAGIITEFATLRHAGAALGIGVVASALVGLAVTYTTMQLLGRCAPVTTEEGARIAC